MISLRIGNASRDEKDWLQFKSQMDRRVNKLLVETAHIQAHDCPRCDSPDCEVAKACSRRGMELDANENPLCQWATKITRLKETAYQHRERLDRAESLGINPVTARLAALDMIPIPPQLLPTDVGAHAKGREVVKSIIDQTATKLVYILAGPTGCGKSTLAAWVAVRLQGAIWIPATIANSVETWEKWRPRATTASYLFVEDLGTERDGEKKWASETWAAFLCDAINAGTPIVITTNSNKVDLVKYGERLRSRLNESAQYVRLGSTDLRTAHEQT